MTAVQRAKTQAVMVARPDFDRALAKTAAEHGAEYILATTIENISALRDRVILEGVRGVKAFTIEARSVAVASGFSPGLVAKLGSGNIKDFVIGIQAEVESSVSGVEIYLGSRFAPGFFAWLAPSRPGKALAGLMARRDPASCLSKFLSFLASSGKIVSADVEFGRGLIPLQPPKRTYGDRFIVLGDAAGQVKPLTGGGIHYSLICADIAAEVLDKCLEQDRLTARDLAAYERCWRKRIGRDIRLGSWVRRLYERLDDSHVERLFGIAVSTGFLRALLDSEDINFDSHGQVVIKALGHAALAGALGVLKRPRGLTNGGRKARI